MTLGQMPLLVELGKWDEATRVEVDYEATAGDELAESDVPREMVYGIWVHLWRGDIVAAKRLRDRLAFLFDQSTIEFGDLGRAVDAALLRAEGRNAEAFDVLDGTRSWPKPPWRWVTWPPSLGSST